MIFYSFISRALMWMWLEQRDIQNMRMYSLCTLFAGKLQQKTQESHAKRRGGHHCAVPIAIAELAGHAARTRGHRDLR